ncbi:hypothetical protein SAMN05216517_11127 [Janthinobacterium sp. OK676]|uniref:hypothetical protein n=1 Tax=Janthinobacterium sp. OK676 TaxID=1855295 RepID=UPI00088DB7BD|nr:hypothetical protein [Janthinobacterium sp. OK676]SDN49939.1 hypothetical protein SAMN05216517_11127 [Janthinobacterium sp. OK676]
MHTKMSARNSVEAGKGDPCWPGADIGHTSARRLKTVGYLTLLLAVVPAASCVATGRAGVPVPFTAMCGVVSCVAPSDSGLGR